VCSCGPQLESAIADDAGDDEHVAAAPVRGDGDAAGNDDDDFVSVARSRKAKAGDHEVRPAKGASSRIVDAKVSKRGDAAGVPAVDGSVGWQHVHCRRKRLHDS
jgi:hypothetical protein